MRRVFEHLKWELEQPELKSRAHGRWRSILAECGVDGEILTRRNKACPLCNGGKDRFTFDDKNGNGDYFCRKCGPGDGFDLLMKAQRIGFPEAKRRVLAALGQASAVSIASTRSRSNNLRELGLKIWNESRPLVPGDEVMRYLVRRGIMISDLPHTLRLHPKLGYYVAENGRTKHVGDFPAMVGLVQDPLGAFVTIHRTYLQNGCKARVADAKKLLSGGLGGGAIRLYEPTGELAIAEGIETCLAVRQRTGQPIWAAINCRNLEVISVPATVRTVHIYADNDADSHFDGQASAYLLARRLVSEGRRKGIKRSVRVYVPSENGKDWCDVLTSPKHLKRVA